MITNPEIREPLSKRATEYTPCTSGGERRTTHHETLEQL